VQLFPIYHPAAALYTPAMLDMLRGDFAALPALLAGGGDSAEAAPISAAAAPASEPELDDAQLTFQF
jgi:DNA polymerase